MHNHTNTGGQSAIGSIPYRVPPQTGAAGFSSSVDGDRHRLHNAITRAWHRLDAAKRKSDFEARLAAKEDLDRLISQLAKLPIVGRVPSQEA